ncbi:MAG: DUF1501 domain-containing protein [Myxococcaceae bacterium]|nr:DUF1501 domain-containing protein [Myxococcaceae bacterium]
MTIKRNFSRRTVLQASAGVAGATLLNGGLSSDAHAQAADKPAVLIINLLGGYNALFSSADSFLGVNITINRVATPGGAPAVVYSGPAFGVQSARVKNLGNGLFVDLPTYGTNLPAVAQANMAAIGVSHGITAHDPARLALMSNGTRSYALMLANAMGGNAAIKCAVVGGRLPDGPRPAEGGVSMQQITNVASTIAALGGGPTDPQIPNRQTAAAALIAARSMSAPAIAENATSLSSVKNALDTAILAQQSAPQTFNAGAIATAYGLPATTTTVNSFAQQLFAAELMILSGTNVVIANSAAGWDTHSDSDGARVRNTMNQVILPSLRVFLQRMMTATGRNVTTLICGDFARSLPGSDHARSLSTTVIGKRVRVGTTGKVSASVQLPAGSPGVPQLWSYLAAASRAPTNPFGANPHNALLLP